MSKMNDNKQDVDVDGNVDIDEELAREEAVLAIMSRVSTAMDDVLTERGIPLDSDKAQDYLLHYADTVKLQIEGHTSWSERIGIAILGGVVSIGLFKAAKTLFSSDESESKLSASMAMLDDD